MARDSGGRQRKRSPVDAGRACAVALLLCLTSCTVPRPAPAPAPAVPSRPPAHAESLVELGDGALARGELALARARYRRALEAWPSSAAARVGLGRVALAQGDRGEARRQLEAALATEPDRADALVALGRLEADEGRRERAFAHARRAVELGPDRPEAHHLLAGLTGSVPQGATAATSAQRVALAQRHPYDPAARLEAGRALLALGDEEAARDELRAAFWIADRGPAAAREAARELWRIDESFEVGRTVAVYVRADETVTRSPAWRMRVRLLLRNASRDLAPWLETDFLPVSIEACTTEGTSGDLLDVRTRCLEGVRPPENGLQAVFTERPVPRRSKTRRLGWTTLLGRRLVVRLSRDEVDSKTLLHEIVHVYGGIHVAKDLESLMNPSGTSRNIDDINARILAASRGRRFGPGSLEANVFPAVDMRPLIEAYLDMLRLNLGFRRDGAKRIREAREHSEAWASYVQREVTSLDPHLGDIANLTAEWMLRSGHPNPAAALYDAAARLYGPRTAAGREARMRFQRVLKISTR